MDETMSDLSPEDRVFLESLSDDMATTTEKLEQFQEFLDQEVADLTERYSFWSPEMRLGAFLTAGDLYDTLTETITAVMLTVGQDPECGHDECAITDVTDERIQERMAGAIAARLSMTIKNMTSAMEPYSDEIQETSDTLHSMGYGRTKED